MRRFLIIYTAVAAAMLCSSCRTGEGGEADPTRAAYMLYHNHCVAMKHVVGDMNRFFAVDLYMKAATDDERHQIHDLYFRYDYIYKQGDDVIVRGPNNGREIKYTTGGKSLTDEGAEWTASYREYGDEYMPRDVVKRVTRLAENEYSLDFPKSNIDTDNSYDQTQVCCTMTVVTAPCSLEADAHLYDYTFTGESRVITGYSHPYDTDNSGSVAIDADVADAKWCGGFRSGRHLLQSSSYGETDVVTATCLEEGSVKIMYKHFEKTYRQLIWY